MRLLFLVSALLGVWCQEIPLQSRAVGSANVTFSVNVTDGIAHVWVQFKDTANLTAMWTAFGVSTIGMTSGGSGSDICLCESTGKVGRYWVTQQAIPSAGNPRRNANGTCTISVVGGISTKTLSFYRAVNNPNATNERAIIYGDFVVLLAKGLYPLAQHANGDNIQVDVSIPLPGAPTGAPTPARGPGAPVIDGYPFGTTALDNKVRVGWELVGKTTVRFAVEATGVGYVALGFQNPTIPQGMNGDAVIAMSGTTPTLGAYTVNYGSTPNPSSAQYYSNGTAGMVSGALRGEFTRTVAPPLAGSVALSDLSNVPVMVAYGNGYPVQHIGRVTLMLNLLTGASQVTDMSPAATPKIVAIIILAVLCFIGFLFTVGLSHTSLGRWCFFRRLCKDSQFLGPRTPACFDLTMGQVFLLIAYFALITLFSRLEFGAATGLRFLRAMGWTSTLTIACASLPVSRHSVLLYFFGMSFERAILIHRVMGRTAILIVLMHFVAVLLEQTYQPFVLARTEIGNYKVDLSLGFWTFMCLLVMFTTSLPIIRRKFFEVFYFTHHLFIVVWVLAILHNKAIVHQLTLIVPIALYAIDRGVRFYRGRIRRRELVSATITADALRLEFKGPIATCTTAESGSYAFINVPKVSLLQWHPFSISSRGGASNFTFHIKNMGPGTYTGALHEFFAKHQSGVTVNVDGPYGRSAVRFEEYESILLLAGGVGITPMVAILDDLYEKSKNGQKPPKLERVTLCWIVQAKETIAWMEEIIKKIQATPSPVTGVTFDVQVYVTRTKEESHLYKAGRPNIPELFAAAGKSKDIAQVGVLACGPEPMVVECQRQAMTVGYDFHKEIFAF